MSAYVMSLSDVCHILTTTPIYQSTCSFCPNIQSEDGACSVCQNFGTASANGLAKPRKPELHITVIGWRNQ
jgi:hypothetical protein